MFQIKHPWSKTLIFYILLLLYFAACTQNKPVSQIEKVIWLHENALLVRSISPSDDDFSDLQSLKEIIGNSRIVLLGEQSHGDGSTFLAKARLIKFLHQEMGFDVLAFESGLYDCNKAWELIQTGDDVPITFCQAVFQIWASSKKLQPLISYLEKTARSDNPLELTGFDCQFTGSLSKIYLVSEIDTFLKEHNISTEDPYWFSFKSSLQNLIQYYYITQLPTIDQREKFFNTCKIIREKIKSDTGPNDSQATFWLQMLESIEMQAKQTWQIYLSTKEGNYLDPLIYQMRDIQMGRNLVWLANELYPNRKIIVWAATFHTVRNLNIIETGDPETQELYNQFSTMGDVVFKEFGDKIYSLGFTSYSGKVGIVWSDTTTNLEKPSKGSFEDLLNRTNFKYAIVDFRQPSKGGEWLQESMMSRPLGHKEMKADWSKVMDGMMFIGEMNPASNFNE